jgi:hypothetical protein
MIELIGELARLIQVVTGLTSGADQASWLSVLLFGVAALAVTAAVVVARAVPVLVAADASRASQRHRPTADPWRILSQSDPDAPGRARPRAPGRGRAAA